MARVCTLVGALMLAIGLITAAVFASRIAHDEDYAKKALIASRNPGNDMYKLDFGFAQIKRGFETVFMSGGILLALNGATLVLLGRVAGRASRAPDSG